MAKSLLLNKSSEALITSLLNFYDKLIITIFIIKLIFYKSWVV